MLTSGWGWVLDIQSEVVNPTPLVPGLFLVGLETAGLASGSYKWIKSLVTWVLIGEDWFQAIYVRITVYLD